MANKVSRYGEDELYVRFYKTFQMEHKMPFFVNFRKSTQQQNPLWVNFNLLLYFLMRSKITLFLSGFFDLLNLKY